MHIYQGRWNMAHRHKLSVICILIMTAALIGVVLTGAAKATTADIAEGNYNITCAPDVSVIYYRNEFAICFDNFQKPFIQDVVVVPQAECGGTYKVSVSSGAPSGDNVVPWTAINCNGTFNLTFTGAEMTPGTLYYVNVQGGTPTQYGNTDGIRLENQPPTISSNVPVSAWYKTNPGSSLDFTIRDDGGSYPNGRLKDAEYAVYSQSGKTGTLIKNWSTVFKNLDANTYPAMGNWAIDWSALQPGDNFVTFKVTDYAGNQAEIVDLFNIRKDTDLPSHTTTPPARYITAGTNLSLGWTGSDGTSGIGCYLAQYKDTSGGSWTNILPGPCTNTTTATFAATEGHTYWLRVQAHDAATNVDDFDKDGDFISTLDTIKPTSTVTNPPQYSNVNPFPVSWNASDSAPGSGLAGSNVQYKIGAAGTPQDWMVGGVGLPGTSNSSESFNGIDGNDYYFRTQAVDNAGNTENTYTAWSTSVLLDLTFPISAVNPLPTYTMSPTTNVTWTGTDNSGGTASGVDCYDVQYSKDGGAWTDWLTCPANTVTTGSFDSTTHGGNGQYDFRVRAKDKATNLEAWPPGPDTSIIFDTTDPVITFVNDGDGADMSFTNSNTTLSANWAANDPETGIDHYEYAIGTAANGNNIVDWTNVGTSTSMTKNGLTLVHNTTYYITVRAYNPAGAAISHYSFASSNGVKADLSAPTTDMSDPNSPYTGATTFLVSWSGADGPGESGIVSYTVQYKDVGYGGWTNWPAYTNTLSTSGNFTGVNSHQYQFRTLGTDASGNVTAAPTSPDYQVATTVDTSNLSAPANISDGSESDPDTDFTSVTTQFSGHWNAVAGAATYLYAIGTTAGGTDVSTWVEQPGTTFTKTGLSLSDGVKYYLTVKAKNFSGTIGNVASSDGITVDLTAPGCAITALPAFVGTAQFSVQWNQTGGPDASGIKNYDIQYKDGAGGSWSDWLTGATLMTSLFNGTNGHSYYLRCRATDNASNTGAYPGAPNGDTGTTVDTSILAPPLTINDGPAADLYFTISNNTLEANWTAVAGAASYVICFGKGLVPTNCDVMPWTDVALVTTYTKNGLSLTEGESYFVRVKAKNNSGIEGPPGASDGVTVDSQAPSTPVVNDEGSFTKDPTQLYATWSATAGVSGIAEYQYAIGTTAGGTQVVGWTTNGTTTNVTKTGLALSNGTSYYISIKARSGAGVWSAAGNSNGILVDTQAPTCAVTALTAYQANNSFEVAWSATDGGSGIANLYDVKYRDGAAGVWTDWLLFSSLLKKNFNGTDEHTYYFQCRAIDNAGNWSAFPGGNGDTSTTVASSAPAAPAVSDGTGADESFSTSPDTLSANWTAVTGAVSYQYAIGTTSGGTELLAWTPVAGTSVTKNALALVNGTKYYASVKGKNNAGIDGAVGTSNGITVDSTPPAAPTVYVPDTVTGSTTTLEASWDAADAESGITDFQVAIGTTAGGTDVKNWFSAGTGNQAVVNGLTLTHGTEYFISVKAVNGVAMWSAVGTSPGVTVNTTLVAAPTAVYDGTGADAAYTSSGTTLSANWPSVDNASSYDYAIGKTPGARDVVDWTNAGASTGVTNSSLTLTDGQRYYVSVRCRNAANVPGGARVSNGILVDTQPPGTPAVTDEGDYSLSATMLNATWTAAAGVSGIKEYKYAVGSTAGGTEVLGWTSNGAATAASISGLTLSQGGPYYISIKAVSNALVDSAAGSSNGISVDTIAPTCVVQPLAQYQGTSIFTVNWLGADAGSGLANYYDVQVRDGDAGTWANWQSGSALATADYLGTDRHTYYFRCRAKDNAGNFTAYVDGNGDTNTRINTTVPMTPVVSDGTGADVAYTTSGDTLSANWPADSDAAAFSYAIGTTPGGTDVTNWTEIPTNSFTKSGLSLTTGTTYYVTVKARNMAMLWSAAGTSNGVYADTAAPVLANVSRPDAYTSSTSTLSASWSASDTGAGIGDYQVSVGTAAGLTDTKDWYSAGAVTSATISGLNLADKATYYINVKAQDKAGNWSAPVTSQSVTVDSTLLPGPATLNDGPAADVDFIAVANALTANWAQITGAAKYQYSIGTASGLRDIAEWADNATTSVTKTGLSLTSGSTYYFNVRGVNNAGIPGVAKSTNGILVDTSAPVTPTVTDDGERVNASEKLHATWTSSDPQSSVAKYEYAVGSSSGATDIKNWTDVGLATEITDATLKLKVGTTYFVAVRATNRAGLVSDPGVSDGIKAVLVADVTVVDENDQPIEINVDNLKPVVTGNPPAEGGDFKTTKELRFVEKNGVGVHYDQLERSYIIQGDGTITDPVEETDLSLSAGTDTKKVFEIVIPVRVINLAMGGRASAIISVQYVYTGFDDSQNRITTKLLLPVKLTSSVAEAQFEVTTVTLNSPTEGQNLVKGGNNVAKATIKLNGAGTLNGVWMLDGEFYRAYRQDIVSETEVAIEQALPANLDGEHTLQFRVTMPDVRDSELAKFRFGEGGGGTTITDFWAGFVHVTGITATLDPVTQTYSGKGSFKLPQTDKTLDIEFKRLKIDPVGGKNMLTRGIIALNLEQKFEFGPLTISITKLFISTDSVAADGSVEFAGTDKVPGIGPFYFYGAGITEKGIAATIKLGSPQLGKIGFLEIGIDEIYVAYDDKGFTLKASGFITTTPEEILKVYLYFGYTSEGTEFDYSVDKKTDWIKETKSGG